MRSVSLERSLLVALALGSLVGCSPNLVAFRHDTHLERYEFTDIDLQKLNFYVSTEVIAHGQAADERVLILTPGTPGQAVGLGDDSIVVSFDEAGEGAPFALERSRQIYRLASPVPGRAGLHRLQTLKDKTLIVGGRRYKVVQGSDAFLVVEEKQLQKLIEKRPHLGGRKAN